MTPFMLNSSKLERNFSEKGFLILSRGLLNISLTWPIHALDEIDINSGREWSKKSVQQGRSQFGARSVLPVREHGKLARTRLTAFFNIPVKGGPSAAVLSS